jgi:hypothetical protein
LAASDRVPPDTYCGLTPEEMSRVSRSLKLDWTLDNQAFDRTVVEGLREHFPELTAEAQNVIVGNYSYSHAK